MQVTRGKVKRAQKAIIYGPEGIGKSTFAAAFPNPLFIDTEGSTYGLDVNRLPRPTSWTMLLEEVKHVRQNPDLCQTLIVDTADWAEQLCVAEICAKYQKKGIEDFGYGKGYVYLTEAFGQFLNLLEEIVERGIHTVLTAHAKMRKFEQPDELGSYDRWEMKLNQKGPASLAKEWADMVLFANYKTYVVNVDGQGAQKGKNKAQGGTRVMYTSHHPCWDAKNRHGLPDELLLDFKEIAHCFPIHGNSMLSFPTPSTPPPSTAMPLSPPPDTFAVESSHIDIDSEQDAPRIPASLGDLMLINGVSASEIQHAVALRGYYPADTPIENYDPKFIEGVLIGAWNQVYQMIEDNRAANAKNMDTPF